MRDPNGKIIHFPSVGALPTDASHCNSCGAPDQPGLICQRCTPLLIDVALTSLSEDVPVTEDEFAEDAPVADSSARRYYGHYEVCLRPDGTLWELGRGAMGVTYKAMDRHLGCPVALKLVNTRSLVGSNSQDRLMQEARTAARLRHPNIASIYHLGLDEEPCYYSMEYIEGETLEHHLRRVGALPLQEALEIAIQTVRALRIAHERRFIHRDIKPGNIMLVRGDDAGSLCVKVIDFGLVKAVTEQAAIHDPTTARYFAGTPHYASPEQVHAGVADARSDLYSLGICLGHMLLGHLFTPADFYPCLETDGHPSVWMVEALANRCPPSVVNLVRSLTAVDPDARPQTAAECLLGLQKCQAGIQRQLEPGKHQRAWRHLSITGGLLFGLAILAVGILQPRFMRPSDSQKQQDDRGGDAEARLLYDEADSLLFKRTKIDTEQASRLFSQAIARAPKFADAYAGLALARFQDVARYGAPRELVDRAYTAAQHAVALDPSRPRGHHALGLVCTLQNRHWEALTHVHKALELDAAYLPAMRDISILWSSVGRPQFGLPWALAATKLEPTKVTAWSFAADACVDLCADEEAEKYYRKCLELVPTSMSAHRGLMHLHLLEGNFDQARLDHSTAESIAPAEVLSLALGAQLELFSGHWDEAEVAYRHLLAVDRTGNVSYYGGISYLSALGFLRCRANGQPEGEAFLAEAAGLHPESEGPHGIYDLAAILCIQGHRAQATTLLHEAVTAGWVDFRSTRLDPRFSGLRNSPEFSKLLDDLKTQVERMGADAMALCAKPLDIKDYPVHPPQT